MPIQTFVNALKSSVDLPAIDNYFLEKQDVVVEILQKVRPEGRLDGDRYKLSSVHGGQGSSFDFNIRSHKWGDWASNNGGSGLISFLQATLKFSAVQVIDWLRENKFLDKKNVIKSIREADGDPLIFPIPEEVSSWDYVSQQRALRKDIGIVTGHWVYRDVDGQILGHKYRIDDRRTTKEVYTLTYRGESGWTKKEWKKKFLPPYGLEKLGASPNIRVLFVEGEKAADKAQEILGDRWKVLSFSGVRASGELWLPDNDFWQGVEVVIWPDNDRAGREAARKIQLKLQSMRNVPRSIRTVRVDQISGIPAKWDLGDWDDACGVDVGQEIERAEEAGSFDEICREWVFVSQQDAFFNLEDRSLVWSVSSFDRTYARFAERAAPPSKKFLIDPTTHKLDDLDFVPGEASIITAPTGKKFLNEWYPTDTLIEAHSIANDESITDEMVAHNARFFIAHLHRICKNETVEPDLDPETGEIVPGTENRDLVDALAWHFSEIVKRPMDKRGWIPLLVSEANGTGKSYFKSVIAAILGPNRSKSITVSKFLGDYDDWRDGTLFYELAETKSHDSTEVYEELKKIHSYKPFNPSYLRDRLNNTDQLNIKTKAQKTQRDFLNGYITSNHLFPLALASGGGKENSDRRLLIIHCETILNEEQAHDLFDDELINRPEWIGAWLLRYRARHKWNPSWVPMTGHKRKTLEIDRQRSEVRSERTELGKFTEFFHFFNFARAGKIGALGRKAFTASQILALCEGNRIKFPYDTGRLEEMLARANVFPAEVRVDVNGVDETVYVTESALVKASYGELRKELTTPLGEAV